jgi:putative transposase
VLGISRSSAYYAPCPIRAADLALMRRIDELDLEHPFAGARILMRFLKREGIAIELNRVGALMCKMGIKALYRKPNTSRKHLAHKIWPYLLRDRKIERSNQVFALDTTSRVGPCAGFTSSHRKATRPQNR